MVKQTDEDLIKKLGLIPIKKKTKSGSPAIKQLTFTSEEDEEEEDKEEINEENIKLIIDKGFGLTSKGLGALPRKYITFQDRIFGIWYDYERFYIGNQSNRITIDGNDLIINDERYKGTHGLWKILTNTNRKKVDKETYDTWWTKKDNFAEKDLNSYKEILVKTHSIYQHNNPKIKKPKSISCKKWNDLVSKIWKEIKTGSGVTKKYHRVPNEYKYIDNLNQLLQRLYFIYEKKKPVTTISITKKLAL